MPTLAHVHPRLGIGPFKKFEPFFLEALRAFPATTEMKIDGGLSPTTIAARMRDSLLGYRLNRWPEADPEFRTLYEQHEGKFVLRGPDKDMRIYFTERTVPGAHTFKGTSFHQAEGTLGKYIKTRVIQDKLPVAAPQVVRVSGTQSMKEIAVLAALRAAGSIDPVVFVGDIRSDGTRELEASSDVVFHYDESRNETILM